MFSLIQLLNSPGNTKKKSRSELRFILFFKFFHFFYFSFSNLNYTLNLLGIVFKSVKEMDISNITQREISLNLIKTVSVILKKAETNEDLTLIFELLSSSIFFILANIQFSSSENDLKKEVDNTHSFFCKNL